MSSEVYIVGAARTPVGSFQGALANQKAPQLGAHAIAAALGQASVDAAEIDEVIMGNVVSAGLKQAPARQAMRQAELPDSCGATTINKVCGSGMKATMLATDLIRAGSAATVVAGGMESMSNAPFLVDKARAGLRMGHSQMLDALFTDGLEDAETGGSMGSFAQNTADQHQLTREAMDAYAIESVNRARSAIENRALASEIAPIEINGSLVADDEQPGRAKIDRIPTLRPAFKADGTITAANASSISDGASALVLASGDALNGREPLAKIIGHATHSIHPSEFTLAPIGAIQKLMEK
ncbi:MAG TPA: acetyl-CoA C-acetyltransferase, partial [Gammaproteobacteria bacterium]|nr:acetyl-CoA C-acetyltransferase [Gammaproteobacteria bacterium]